MGVPQKIMRAHCAVIWQDHFKFASYGPALFLVIRKIRLAHETIKYGCISGILRSVSCRFLLQTGRSISAW